MKRRLTSCRAKPVVQDGALEKGRGDNGRGAELVTGPDETGMRFRPPPWETRGSPLR